MPDKIVKFKQFANGLYVMDPNYEKSFKMKNKKPRSNHGYKHVFDFKRGDTLWAHESMYVEGKNNTEFNPQEIHDHAVKRTIPGFG